MSEKAPVETAQSEYVKWMSRHIVGLTGTYFTIDKDGRPEPDEHLYFFPGFVMDVLGTWCYITAAHNIEDVFGEYVRKGWIRVNDDYSFMDYFGPDSKVKMLTRYDYGNEPNVILHNRDLGLDIAIFPLRPYYRQQLEANGVVPFEQRHWKGTYSGSFERYAILGSPEKLMERLEREGERGPQVGMGVSLAYLNVQRLKKTPEGLEEPPGHWFIGKVQTPVSLKGMSGGPIFGFRRDSAGDARYWLVALQSRWLPDQQVLYGSPISPVMTVVEDELRRIRSRTDQRGGESAET